MQMLHRRKLEGVSKWGCKAIGDVKLFLAQRVLLCLKRALEARKVYMKCPETFQEPILV